MGRKALIPGQRTSRAGKTLSKVIEDWNNKVNSTGKWVEKTIEGKYFAGGFIMQPLKTRLLFTGISGDGTKLAPYSKRTKKLRRKAGLKTSPTTLRFSGKWYRSMFVRYESLVGKRHIISIRTRPDQNEKTEYLKKKYGVGILQINEQEQMKLLAKLSEEYNKIYDTNIKIDLYVRS